MWLLTANVRTVYEIWLAYDAGIKTKKKIPIMNKTFQEKQKDT